MKATLTVNTERNGLELYFSGKPGRDVLTALKDARWRYHRAKKCWYARQSEANRAFALQLVDGESAMEPAKADEAEPYFPPYDVVNGTPIYHSSDLSCWEHDAGYFQDISAYVTVRTQQIVIVDLTNALIPGKECPRIVMTPANSCPPAPMNAGLDTFRAVYDAFFVRREKPVLDCNIHETQLKSMQVFTPFKEIRPIKTPARWTLPHVWKAILAGQIYEGYCNGRYTDDYAYDAAVNFRSGVPLHLPSFAKELIEDSSGWRVYPDKEDGGRVQLSVDCHTFDLNTLQFDAACDWPENIRRREERQRELEEHNARMQARMLSAEQIRDTVAVGFLFDVETLEMDDNTGRYEIRKALMTRGELLADSGAEVVSIKDHPIADDALFEIACNAGLEADARVILHDHGAIVSGRALREMLADETSAARIYTVQECRQSWEKLRKDLEDRLSGRVQILFNPTPRSRLLEVLARLDAERARLQA